jgi:hypothetical protein
MYSMVENGLAFDLTLLTREDTKAQQQAKLKGAEPAFLRLYPEEQATFFFFYYFNGTVQLSEVDRQP